MTTRGTHAGRRALPTVVVGLVALCLVGLAPESAASAQASGFAVEGIDRSRMLPPAGADVVEYSNVGYRLGLVDGEALIEVDASPLASRAPFAPPEAPPVELEPAIVRLARSVTAGSTTEYEASARLLGWIARNIEYELDRAAPQDAASVLERRTAFCTGVARLAVALSRAVGLEAREVAGYVYGEAVGGPQGYHRWIETRLSDRGWVFSDPLHSHHYVPSTYLRLASEEIRPETGLDGLLVERRDEIDTVDAYPLAVPGIRARRNSERRLAAAVHVAVEDRSNGVAVLEGHATRWTHSLIDGETTFVGLEPGEYQLRLLVAGVEAVERTIRLAPRQRASISLSAEPQRAPATTRSARLPRSIRPGARGVRASSP